MKPVLSILLVCILLTACVSSHHHGAATVPVFTVPDATETTAQTTIEPTEPGPELKTVLVYVPNENADGFYTVEIAGENISVLNALIQAGVLNEDVQINGYTWSGETVTIDFNQAFADQVCSMGTAGEYMIMGAVVNTMLANNNAAYVMITVDGQILESGHVIYDFPMEFFK